MNEDGINLVLVEKTFLEANKLVEWVNKWKFVFKINNKMGFGS